MNIRENAQHEAIKTMLKNLIDNNPSLSEQEKTQKKQELDRAAFGANIICSLMKQYNLDQTY